MKRSLRRQILPLAALAACMSCSRTSHLYQIAIVSHIEPDHTPPVPSQIWEHHLTLTPIGCDIYQIKVPCGAAGHEYPHTAQEVAFWRTYTDIAAPRFFVEFHGPIWAVALGLFAFVTAILALPLFLWFEISHKLPRTKPPQPHLPPIQNPKP